MHRGYVKQWRKEMESDVWDMPPVAYKLWRYILMQADRRTGKLRRSCPQLAEAIQWMENNAVVIPDRRAISRHLHQLEAMGSISAKLSGGLSRKTYEISICNWDTYESTQGGLVPVGSGLVPADVAGLSQRMSQPSGCAATPSADTTGGLVPAKNEGLSQRMSSVQEVQEVQEVQPTADGQDPAPPQASLWEPDDPAYAQVAGYDGKAELALWSSSIGTISPSQAFEAQNALIRMHTYFKLSVPQIRALIDHIAADADARKFWGTRKSPSGWMKRDAAGVHTWEKIAAHAQDSKPEELNAFDAQMERIMHWDDVKHG